MFGVNYDQKIPRQARPIIQRKESDKVRSRWDISTLCRKKAENFNPFFQMMHGSVSPPGGVTSEASPSPTDFSHLGGSEFRDRVQTAPTILRRQRKNTQVMVENNNTEGKSQSDYYIDSSHLARTSNHFYSANHLTIIRSVQIRHKSLFVPFLDF